MGKYSSRQKQVSGPKRNVVNPYMRGIGCFLMILVPAFSYLTGDYLAKQGVGWQVLPGSWYVAMNFPPIFYKVTGLNIIAGWLGSIKNLPATLAIGAVVLIIVGGILSIVYGYMYSMLRPSKYGPGDIPPPRVKTKKYKR